MSFIRSGRSWAALGAVVLLAATAAVPAHARTSLADLQAQLDAAQARLDAMVANPCPTGTAVTGFQADGTPICRSFVIPTATFAFDFVQGTPGIADAVAIACPAWQEFVNDAGAAGVGTLTVDGSAGTPRTCSDPVKVAQITQALVDAQTGPTTSGNSAVIECDGFNWAISNFCASTANGAPGAPQAGLKVAPVGDPVPQACACQSAGENIYVVRPCIGNQNWGGVGTDVCSAPSQTITVTLE